MNQELKAFFQKTWIQYTKLNPDALKIHQLLESREESVVNDHIAYRTLRHPRFGIQSLIPFFEKYGYKEKGEYNFKVKKLYAIHMEHPEDPSLPKIFISELLMDQFSEFLQNTLNRVVMDIPFSAIECEDFCYSGRHWVSSHKVYQELYEESEYAAWFYTFGFCANHFTVNLNIMNSFKEVSELNSFLIEQGFKMNESGGLVKGSPQQFLEQSSTMAYQKEVKFKEGPYEIPSCYYEFAKRYPLPDSKKLYQGFVAQSADKIFESTNKY